jgi:hypothetical protein
MGYRKFNEWGYLLNDVAIKKRFIVFLVCSYPK